VKPKVSWRLAKARIGAVAPKEKIIKNIKSSTMHAASCWWLA
jgi:hypothetical protein